MKTKIWSGGFLKTILLCVGVICAAMFVLSMVFAALILNGAIDESLSAAAACGISVAAVFLGCFLAARGAASQKLLIALTTGGCCWLLLLLLRLTVWRSGEGSVLPGTLCVCLAALLAGITACTRPREKRRKKRR